MTNLYCDKLGIDVPVLENVRDHREANVYALLIVALLEHGAPMTLPEVAARMAECGVAPADEALRALQRCRPARAPVYRDGDYYALDPYDAELDLWLFRLGLLPQHQRSAPLALPSPPPLPGPEQPLSVAELDEAWSGAGLSTWSLQRIVVSVLDAAGGPMTPADVVTFVDARTQWHSLTPDSTKFRRRNAAVRVRDDGRWEIATGTAELVAARRAVRDRLETMRRSGTLRQSPAELETVVRSHERQREESAARLAELSRVLVHVFPVGKPVVMVLIDVESNELTSYHGAALEEARTRMASYDIIAAVGVRATLRGLGINPEERRIAELGPPQKTMTIEGRTLALTTAMLVRGSCGINRRFGDEDKLHDYLRRGQLTQLRRRLEADARALCALYRYGRLHGHVRVRWGLVDEMLPAPWVHHDELGLHHLKRKARALGIEVEVVVGASPGWDDSWARAQRCYVEQLGEHQLWLVDELGAPIYDRDVQMARLTATIH